MHNKLLILGVFIFGSLLAGAQVSTEPAEDINPEDSLKIIVDVSKLSGSEDYVQNLKDAATRGEPMYIWTWKPYEFPAGHPKTNGLGTQAWKNSNDTLRMKMEAPNVYSWTIIPTEWYEVDAATVYNEDIHFLVKPKDGGGYGDPDIKSNDMMIAIDPPKLERDPSYAFPEVGQQDDVFTIYYENFRESKPSMQNLSPDEAYVFAQATLSDSSIVEIEPSFFTVGTNPKLKMDYVGSETFRKFIYPQEFFPVPAGLTITRMRFIVMRQQFASSADRADNDVIMELGCP